MEQEIDLSVIWGILKKNVTRILVLMVLGALIATGLTLFVMKPVYQSSTQLLVNQTSTQNDQQINLNQIQTNVQLINTYKDIIMGDGILNTVRENLEQPYTNEALRGMISVNAKQNSQAFDISVRASSPTEAAQIATVVSDVFRDQLSAFYPNVQNINVISEATPNPNKVSPSLGKNLVIAMALGFVLAVAWGFLKEMMDSSVKEDKIFEQLGWTNLGSIPELSTKELKETRFRRARPVDDGGRKRV